jgi:hypothetical protein
VVARLAKATLLAAAALASSLAGRLVLVLLLLA